MKVLLLLLIPLGGYILNNLYPDEAKNLISFTKQILPYLLLLIVAIFIHWVKMQIKNASGKEMDEGKEYLGDAISKEVIKVKYTKENISYSKVLFFIGMILLICAMVWSYLFPNSNIKNDRLLLFFLCTCGISLYYAFRIKKWEMRRKKLRIGNKEK